MTFTRTTSQRLQEVLAAWRERWPAALGAWSRYIQLSEPRWCLTPDEERRESLTGSFAMIRLTDHAVVISLRQVVEQKLEAFATEILAHEIGHHVYCPADLTDNARGLARIRAGLPTKEHLAPFIANLYFDLLINDRLQRAAALNLAGVYLRLVKGESDRLWTLYMRTYELLWRMDRGSLARGTIDERLNSDAQLGARLIRSYAKEWLDGAGRFAMLCLPYLLEDEAKHSRQAFEPWHDTKSAGAGGQPDGLTEAEDAERSGAVHPAEDSDLTGVTAETKDDAAPAKPTTGARGPEGTARATQTGQKSVKQFRDPIEYAEVLRATGIDLSNREIAARYYRERALPYLVKFPSRQTPESSDPLPEGLDTWDIDSPLEDVDWSATLSASPQVIPGVTTRQRLYGTTPGTNPQSSPIDLYLGVDCSGSMGDPATRLSYPVLAGAIIALSALRAGSRVMVALSGEPGRTVTTDGFIRDETLILKTLTGYLGTGNSFGIHRLSETFDAYPPTARAAHILVVSDNDIFNSLERQSGGRPGWDVARMAVAKARGGGTHVLQLPEWLMTNPTGKAVIPPGIERMQSDGWNVSTVDSMDQLVEFARRFSQSNYGEPARTPRLTANP